MRAFRPPLGDIALAVVLALLAAAEIAGTNPSARGFVFAAAVPIPLAWRLIVPLGAPVATLTMLALDGLSGGDPLDLLVPPIVILVALYSLGAHAELEKSLAVLAGYLAVGWVSVYAERGSGPSDYAFAGVVVAPWIVGRIAGVRLAAAVSARERAQRAVAEERARIARELHDVVAHAVGVMVVQAGAAEQILENDPPAAREALARIRRTGKDALVDLRRMLGLLRADDQGAASVEPQPGLRDLEPLAERLRHAGLPVELSIEGEERPVPAGVALAAYRVVQEGLTNVLKHTTDARAQVTLVYGSEALELSVTNDGRPTTNGAGTGHGLIGLRERVSLYGGELEAAPLDGGGFRVCARLPYE